MGGMGAVFRARHLRLDREVAVKILPPSLYAGAAAEARFVQEARLCAKLDDPRIVAVYDVGVEDSMRYIVMALVKGVTLSQAVRARGPLSQEEARRVMRDVMLGLSAAHKADVIHRDVKPGNIIVDGAGVVKLMDFGVAAGRLDRPDSGSELVAGTLEYMAPEQGFGAPPDPRMDLYAWAGTYYFALTGKPPYDGNGADVMIMHREAEVPDVRTPRADVSPDTAELLKRCMAKFPDNRPASAAEVLSELDRPGFLAAARADGGFKLLPPPPEAAGKAAPRAAPPLQPRGLIPEPPPPIDLSAGRPSAITAALFGGLYLFFFGRPWLTAVPADWAAGIVAAALAAVSLSLAGGGERRRVVGPLLWLAMLAASVGAAGDLRAAAVDIDILAVLGAASALAGTYVGFLEPSPDGRSGAALIAAGGGCLLAAAAACHAGPAQPWAEAIPAWLRAQWADWSATGGGWRWSGLLALYCAYWTFRLSAGGAQDWARKATADGRILNWNR